MKMSAWRRSSNLMSRYKGKGILLTLMTALATCDVFSDELSWPDTLQIHGFTSQAYILTTDDNDFFGNSEDDGTFDFRELGINASLRPFPKMLVSAQLLSRDAGESDDGDIRLDYGLVDYSLVSEAESLFGIRLGRITNPLGFYNETRDVAITRPSILLPQSIYFDRTRNLALSSDGGQLYGEYRTGMGDFMLQLALANPRTEGPEVERALLGDNFPGELEGDISYGGRLLYEKDGGRIRLGISGVDLNINYDPKGLADPLQAGSIDFDLIIFSAQYNAEHWSLTGEYAIRKFDFSDFGPLFSLPDNDFIGESFYVQGTYRFNPKWEAVARYDVLFADRDDRDGEEFEAATDGLPSHSRFAKDFTVGLRWDITPSFMFRAEYHNVNGTAWLPRGDNPNPLETDRYWDLFTLLISYRF